MTEPITPIHISWPPTLENLKTDMKRPLDDTRDDALLSYDLNAVYGFVAERKKGLYRFDATDPEQLELPDAPHDFRLGILRLAARWNSRRRSQDATIQMQELGIGRVASTDPDIDRALRLGRYNGVGVFA